MRRCHHFLALLSDAAVDGGLDVEGASPLTDLSMGGENKPLQDMPMRSHPMGGAAGRGVSSGYS